MKGVHVFGHLEVVATSRGALVAAGGEMWWR
jgi:hypothetical protein